jgi:hypothetical protein
MSTPSTIAIQHSRLLAVLIAAVVIAAATTWAATHLVEPTGEPLAPAPANLARPAVLRTAGVDSLAFDQPAAADPQAPDTNDEMRGRQL